MNIKHKIAEYFGLIDSYERIVVIEQRMLELIKLPGKMFRIGKRIDAIEKKQAKRYPHLIDRLDKLEDTLGIKDSYIDSIIDFHESPPIPPKPRKKSKVSGHVNKKPRVGSNRSH